MKIVQKLLAAAGTAAMLAFASGVSAAPVPFTITSAQFLPEAGYGIDADEASGNLLDVRFSNALFSPQSFVLSAVNQSFSFNFGVVDFEEPISHAGILAAELDALGIAAKLTFGDPAGMIQTINATGSATLGAVADLSVDLVIDWSPVTILFGNGGAFRLSFSDLAFTDVGQKQSQIATITLLSLPGDLPPISAVPEPSSIALFGVGLGCCLFTRRRRNKA